MLAVTTRTVRANGCELVYVLEKKDVKNINLRVRRDGSVYVSCPRRCDASAVDALVMAKMAVITEAQRRAAAAPRYEESANTEPLTDAFERICPIFQKQGLARPELRVRKMKSRWGSCIPEKCVITLNSALAAVPARCIDYVIIHEFCHFFHPNHSKAFYDKVACFMPDWKERRKELNDIVIV